MTLLTLKSYHVKCNRCGFEFSVTCEEKDFEQAKEEILRCPCGRKAQFTEISICEVKNCKGE